MNVNLIVGSLALILAVSGCGQREVILPGERIGVREAAAADAACG